VEAAFSFLRRIFRVAGIVAACLQAQAACAEVLAIPGSGNPERVLIVLANAFNSRQAQFQVSIPPSTGTAGAIRDVEAGSASLGRVGRPLKKDETAGGLTYVPLGRDPVVFAGGAGVTVPGLTAEQIVDIYTGKATNWREFGGRPGPIRVVSRETTDASRQAISKVIKAFQTIEFGNDAKVVHLDPQMIELLDRFPGSLGFLNRSALAAAKTKLVYLTLDGIEPSAENVESGRYVLWLEFGLIHKTDYHDPAARAFVEFVRSPAGRAILGEQGILVSTGLPGPRG
jgi:phosphate transport system substrate-binding protein